METAAKRYVLLDSLRGLALLSMFLYHGTWDLVYAFGVDLPWYATEGAFLWQQSILFTFLLLSGFCWSMGRRKVRRGVIVLLCSAVISAVTAIFLPESAIRFGVLSLIGSAVLLMIPIDRLTRRLDPRVCFGASLLLFALTRRISRGYLGLWGWALARLPDALYASLATAWLGFPPSGFSSSDYVPLLPWFFLYFMGHCLYRMAGQSGLMERLPAPRLPPLEWLGRHSLLLYMAHQPVIYGVLYLFFHTFS